jgi:hypothetical protein
MNWQQQLISGVVSRIRAVINFTADEKGPRISAGIELDRGAGDELPPLDAPKRPRKRVAKKKAAKKTTARRGR